jgi:hypothetical protein
VVKAGSRVRPFHFAFIPTFAMAWFFWQISGQNVINLPTYAPDGGGAPNLISW